MENIRRLWILGLVFSLFSCAGVKDWDEYAKYQEKKGFKREEYEKKLLKKGEKVKKGVKESLYEKEIKRTYTRLLKEPPVPLKVPDTVVRVLILPYVDESGSLNSAKYVFFKVEEGKWILGDYLIKEGKSVKVLTPLKKEEREDEGR